MQITGSVITGNSGKFPIHCHLHIKWAQTCFAEGTVLGTCSGLRLCTESPIAGKGKKNFTCWEQLLVGFLHL